MSVRTFFRLAGIVIAALVVYGAFLLLHQWDERRIGEFDVRQNTITGVMQIKIDNQWRAPFDNDPYAMSLSPADLARIRVLDGAWGGNGIYCARALVSPGPALKGRLALRLTIYDTARHESIHEHELRETVDWPGGALTPFVLRTGLFAPTEKNERTIVTFQPALYSGS